MSDEINESKASIEKIYDHVIREKSTGQWIDVKALKPKIGEEALFGHVTEMGAHSPEVGQWSGKITEFGVLVVNEDDGDWYPATHWMPIPDLPEST